MAFEGQSVINRRTQRNQQGVGTPAGWLDQYKKGMGMNYSGQALDGSGNLVIADTGGLGSYGTYEGIGLDKAAYDAISGTDAASGLQKSDGGLASNLSGLGSLISAGVTAFDAYNKYKMGNKLYDLEKDKFDYNKALMGADYTARAKGYNEELGRSTDVGLALAGSSMTDAQKAAARNKAQQYAVKETV